MAGAWLIQPRAERYRNQTEVRVCALMPEFATQQKTPLKGFFVVWMLLCAFLCGEAFALFELALPQNITDAADEADADDGEGNVLQLFLDERQVVANEITHADQQG